MARHKFYKTKQWKRTREAVLRRDGYQCQESKRYGKRVAADTVHHIFPLLDYPEYKLEAWNLISLSGPVHDSMHDRATGDLTEVGRDLMERTARRRGIEL